MLNRIISGGQTGADQAGLHAARRLGLQTGGWATKGFLTLDGQAPWLGREFGLVETPTVDYPTRTAWNVRDSDATVRFAVDFMSPGERCTLKALRKYNKPYIDIQTNAAMDGALATITQGNLGLFRAFLDAHNVRVLNVAGNTERRAPGIGFVVEEFLVHACRM